MEGTVLVLTNSEDESAPFVLRELDALGVPYYRFDTERYPHQVSLELELQDRLTLCLHDGSYALRGEDIRSVWNRRPVPSIMPETLAAGHVAFIQKEASAARWSFETCLDAFWVNPPITSHAIQHNKLFQLEAARRAGLAVPDTLITNRPDTLVSFMERHGGRAAMKMMKGGFFVKEDGIVPHFIFTQLVTADEVRASGEDVALCPIFAQEYVAKSLELRVTLAGARIYACAIHSQDSPETAVDWRRYDFEKVRHEAYELPEEVSAKLLALMRELGIVYGAVDLILTPDGEFVFLEVNEGGQWVWIEQLTGLRISRGIAELLAYGK